MRQNRIQLALMAALAVALILIAILSVRAANPPAPPPPPPTVDLPAVVTEAISTFAGGLTGTAQAVPTSTSTQTATLEASATAGTPSTASASGSPTPTCYRLKYLQDVTIPDATIMVPAQVFTKTWQVQNTGTCALRPGFQLVLVGGTAMGGSPFVLSTTVNPGTKFDLSIKMAAPTTQTGLIQGTWRMIDDNYKQFGDALTVVIVIGNASGAAPTAAATSTP